MRFPSPRNKIWERCHTNKDLQTRSAIRGVPTNKNHFLDDWGSVNLRRGQVVKSITKQKRPLDTPKIWRWTWPWTGKGEFRFQTGNPSCLGSTASGGSFWKLLQDSKKAYTKGMRMNARKTGRKQHSTKSNGQHASQQTEAACDQILYKATFYVNFRWSNKHYACCLAMQLPSKKTEMPNTSGTGYWPSIELRYPNLESNHLRITFISMLEN